MSSKTKNKKSSSNKEPNQENKKEVEKVEKNVENIDEVTVKELKHGFTKSMETVVTKFIHQFCVNFIDLQSKDPQVVVNKDQTSEIWNNTDENLIIKKQISKKTEDKAVCEHISIVKNKETGKLEDKHCKHKISEESLSGKFCKSHCLEGESTINRDDKGDIKKCKVTLRNGKNKGKECGKPVFFMSSHLCATHVKQIIRNIKSEEKKIEDAKKEKTKTSSKKSDTEDDEDDEDNEDDEDDENDENDEKEKIKISLKKDNEDEDEDDEKKDKEDNDDEKDLIQNNKSKKDNKEKNKKELSDDEDLPLTKKIKKPEIQVDEKTKQPFFTINKTQYNVKDTASHRVYAKVINGKEVSLTEEDKKLVRYYKHNV